MKLNDKHDEAHGLRLIEVVLSDEDIKTGLEFMEPVARELTKGFLADSKCSVKLAGFLEVVYALENKDILESLDTPNILTEDRNG